MSTNLTDPAYLVEVHERAREIANALGPSWKYDEKASSDPQTKQPYIGAVIQGPEYAIYIDGPGAYTHKGKGRASVSLPRGPNGEWINWFPNGVQAPSCLWTWTRELGAVVGHIRRSVLDPMRVYWPMIAKQMEETYGYEKRLRASFKRAYTALDLLPTPTDVTRHRQSVGSLYSQGVEIQPESEEWELTVRLPIDQAEALVSYLRATYPPKRG